MGAGLELPPAPMQDRLGVAAGLFGALQDQLLGSQERDAVVEVRSHRPVRGVSGILLVHQRSHPLQASPHILFGDDAMP